VLQLMAERARFMATQPGFVSVSLHKSEDGSHVVNYVQWNDRKKTRGRSPFARVPQEMARFGELVKEAEPCLYQVTHVEAA